MLVNLGIGIPTLVANHVPSGMHIYFQSENGLIGTGPVPQEGLAQARLTDAAGRPVSALPGACAFDSAMSFGLIRGGHLDMTVLGGLQVDEHGLLANWTIPGKMVPGMGGAMDLVAGARRVVVAMQHRAKGQSKLVRRCSLPLTSVRPVDLLVTDLAVIGFPGGRATLAGDGTRRDGRAGPRGDRGRSPRARQRGHDAGGIDHLTDNSIALRCARRPARPIPKRTPMNTLRRSLLLGLAALALAGCASRPDVSRIADPDVDFHSYRTFAFIPADGNPSLIDRRLLGAARSQLERRGYAFDDLDPDLLVNIAAVVEERQGLRTTPGSSPVRGAVETEDYRLGRLAVDLVDARRRQVVWHGAAEGRVSPAMLRDAGTAVETAVAAVFEGFPVQAGASGTARATKAH